MRIWNYNVSVDAFGVPYSKLIGSACVSWWSSITDHFIISTRVVITNSNEYQNKSIQRNIDRYQMVFSTFESFRWIRKKNCQNSFIWSLDKGHKFEKITILIRQWCTFFEMKRKKMENHNWFSHNKSHHLKSAYNVTIRFANAMLFFHGFEYHTQKTLFIIISCERVPVTINTIRWETIKTPEKNKCYQNWMKTDEMEMKMNIE